MHTILVVEDQKLIRTMLCDTLQEHNYNTLEAADGIDGLNMIEDNEISLVVTDLVMPNYDGADFLSLLKTCHSGIEAIAMTSIAPGSEIYQRAAKIIGEDRILPKSSTFDVLIEKIQSILG